MTLRLLVPPPQRKSWLRLYFEAQSPPYIAAADKDEERQGIEILLLASVYSVTKTGAIQGH